MDVRELIDTLSNVADKSAAVRLDMKHGDVTLLGVLLKADKVILVSAAPEVEAAPELPTRLLQREDVDLAWPEGTLVKDADNDVYARHGDHWTWITEANGKARPVGYHHDSDNTLKANLPARVIGSN